jgi:hypothetical protein
MADLKENVKKMLEAGVPREEIGKYVQKYSVATGQKSVETAVQPTQPVQAPEDELSFRAPPESAKWATPARDVIAEYVRPAAEAGASMFMASLAPTAGATAATGGATTPLLAAIGLGALGFGAVKTGLDWVDAKLSEYESSIPKHEKADPASPWQGIKQGLENYRQGLMFELLGRGTGEAIGRVGGAFVKKPKTPIEEYAEELGQRLTRREVTQKRSLQLLETVLEKAPSSANVMADARFQQQLRPLMEERARLLGGEASEKQLRDIGFKIYKKVNNYLTEVERLRGVQLEQVRQEVLGTLGGNYSYESIGLSGKEAIKVANKAMRDRADALYQKVGDRFKIGENIPTPNLNRVAEKELTKYLKLPAQESAFMKRLRWAATGQADDAEQILEILQKRSGELSGEQRQALFQKLQEIAPRDPSAVKDWQTLAAFRAELRALKDQGDVLKAQGSGIQELDSIRKVYVDLKEAVELDMKAAAAKRGGDAWIDYQNANAFYRTEISDVFKTKVIRDIYKANPEKVLDVAFRPNAITELRILRKALQNHPDEMKALEQGLVNRFLGVGREGAFDPKFLKSQLNKYGQDYLIEAFGVDGYSSLRKAAEGGTHILLGEAIGDKYLRSIARPDTLDTAFVVDNIIGASEAVTNPKYLEPNLRLLRDVLSDKDLFDDLSQIYLERLFTPEMATNVIDPVKLSQQLHKNQRVLKLWYPAEKYNRLMKIAEVGARQKSASKLARGIGEKETLATLMTTGIVLRAVASPSIESATTATAVAVGPKMLAKLYLSENGIQLLQQASTLPTTSAKAAEISTKLLTIVYGTPGVSERAGGIEGAKAKLKKKRLREKYSR